MATTPTFCRIDYFDTEKGEWWRGHEGLNLMNPEKYVLGLADNDTIARLIEVETGEVIASNEDQWDLSGFDMDHTDMAADLTPVVDTHEAYYDAESFDDDDDDDDDEPETAVEWPIPDSPHDMNREQLRAALMAEGDFTDAEVNKYGPGFMVKALIALRTPKPEPTPEEDEDMFEDLDEFDDEEVPDISSMPKSVRVMGAALDPKGMGSIELVEPTPEEEEDMFDDLDDLDEFDDYDGLVEDEEDDVPNITTLPPADSESNYSDVAFADDEDIPDAEEAGQALFIGMPGTKDYIFDGHAGAGPSGAERWMVCTASLGASRAFLETLTANQQAEFAKAGTAARQGTTAHMIGESEARLLLGQISEDEHNNLVTDLSISPPDGEEYDDEMAEYLTEYNDLVKQFVQTGHEVHVEMRVSAAVPLTTVDYVDESGETVYHVHEIRGSADFVAMPLPRTSKAHPIVLTVGDLKYGQGKDVDADENPQAMIYALGVIGELAEQGEDIWDIDFVDIIIIQPRLGGIKTWRTTVDDLLEWRDEVLSPALTEALGGLKGGAKFVPGEVQCNWCPARGGCSALAEARMDSAVELFDVMIEAEAGGDLFPELVTLSNDRLAVLYSQIKDLVDLEKEMKAEMQRRLHRGQSVPGYQLVNYTPRSEWKPEAAEALDPDTFDPEDIPEDVIEMVWARQIKTPTQAIKALGKGREDIAKRLEELIDRPEKRPVVAPEGDRRKPWEGRPPEAMFDAIAEPEGIPAPAGMFEVMP